MNDSVTIARDFMGGDQDTKLYQLLDSLTSGIFLVNSDLQVTYLNAYGRTCFTQLCGEELIWDMLLEQPTLLELKKNIIEVFDTQAVDRSELIFTNSKREQVWLGFTLTCPESKDDMPAMVFGVFKDITNLKSAEQKRGWDYGVQSISMLASGMAQEFHQLFDKLSHYLDLYHEDKNVEQKLIQVVEETVDRGAKVVANLRHFTSNSSSNSQESCLSESISSVLGVLEAEFVRQGIVVSTSFESSGKVCIPSEIAKKVFLDLLTNCIISTPELGSIEIRSYPQSSGYEIVELRSDRQGLSDEDLRNLFVPYASSDYLGGWSDPKIGILDGPGLFLTYAVLREYGGDLSAETSERGGLMFKLKFRAAVD